ncbi:MAG TPA: response regulator transcription factor [Stellaceae bacterium]|nr:response regulator transcription factor [Stellaceae bacterium]
MTTHPIRILVIDDEPAIRRLLKTSLSAEGYEVEEAATGEAGWTQFNKVKPDLVLLDLGLPDIDGREVIKRVRGLDSAGGGLTPIIVLSIRSDERGKVEALDLGADDYVAKPVGMDELNARVRAALRHRLQQEGAEPIFKSGDLAVDLVRRHVTVKGQEVKLSPKEYDLLRLLVMHAGKVLTHAHIMREVWGAATDVQYLRIYIRQLRHKIEAEPDRPTLILTESGVGYRLKVDA